MMMRALKIREYVGIARHVERKKKRRREKDRERQRTSQAKSVLNLKLQRLCDALELRSWSLISRSLKMIARGRERMLLLIKMVAEKGDERTDGRTDGRTGRWWTRTSIIFQKGCFAVWGDLPLDSVMPRVRNQGNRCCISVFFTWPDSHAVLSVAAQHIRHLYTFREIKIYSYKRRNIHICIYVCAYIYTYMYVCTYKIR